MGAPEIVVAVISGLTLVLGSGFAVTWWRGRSRIRISALHQAMNGEYQVVATVANAGDHEQHLEEIHLVAVSELKGGWTQRAIETPVEVDLPARGRPAKETFTLPAEWVDQRSEFRVKAKISSRSKPFCSKKLLVDQAVLNVIEAAGPA